MTGRSAHGAVEPRSVLVVLVAFVFAAVVISVVVPNSPYDADIAVERDPFAPERPVELNRTMASSHAVAYEEQVLRNHVLGSRGFSLDKHDEVRTRCAAASVQRRRGTDERFRVRLQCRGDIADVNRPVQPSGFEYVATYAVTTNETRRVSVDGYPYEGDDTLATAIPDDAYSPAPEQTTNHSAQSGFSRGGLKTSMPRTISSPRFSTPWDSPPGIT